MAKRHTYDAQIIGDPRAVTWLSLWPITGFSILGIVFVSIAYKAVFEPGSQLNTGISITNTQRFEGGAAEHSVHKHVYGDVINVSPKDDPAILERLDRSIKESREIESSAQSLLD